MRALISVLLLAASFASAAEDCESSGTCEAASLPPDSKPEGEAAKPKVKGIDTSSWNPLHFASWSGNDTAVAMLLAAGEFPLEQRDDVFGMTPLLFSSYRGHRSIVKMLLGKGAYPLVTCKKGVSPLEYAKKKDHKAVIKLLEKAVAAALTPEEEESARMGAVVLLIVAGILCAWQFWESRNMVAPPLTKSQKEEAKRLKEEAKKKESEKVKRKSEKKAKKEKHEKNDGKQAASEADLILMGVAPEHFIAFITGLYEFQDEHSGGERPVYKLQGDDSCYLYYCDAGGQWIVGEKGQMLEREAAGYMVVTDDALTPDDITAKWKATNGSSLGKDARMRGLLPATTANRKALEQQREEEEKSAQQQAEERGNITLSGLASTSQHFNKMGVYELMDMKEKWMNRRPVYKHADVEHYLYFSSNGNWMVGTKANVDKGNGGEMNAPDSGCFTPDAVPTDEAWEANLGKFWREVPVLAAHN